MFILGQNVWKPILGFLVTLTFQGPPADPYVASFGRLDRSDGDQVGRGRTQGSGRQVLGVMRPHGVATQTCSCVKTHGAVHQKQARCTTG